MSNKSASARVFTPPLFGKFGSKAKDLFKKKYEFDNQATFKESTTDGIKIETTIVAPADDKLRGVFKSTIPFSGLGVASGELESEFHTVADKESKNTYTFNKLAKGFKLKVGLTGVKPDAKSASDFAEGWASAEAEYAQEYFAGSVGVRTDSTKTLVDVVASAGYDNLSVGGKVTINPREKSAPSDYNFGAQVEGRDYVASAVTEKKRSNLLLSYHQTLSRRHQVGAQASFGLTKPSRSLTFGSDYEVDADTRVRAYVKVDGSNTTTAAFNVEHQLANPNSLTIGVSAEFNVASTLQPGRVGVSLQFGDR